MRVFRALLGAISAITPTAPPAAEARPPTGRWVVNFDAAQCLASRNYGTDKAPLFVVLKAPPLGDVIQLAIMRHGSEAGARQIDAKLQFGGASSVETTLLSYKPVGGGLRTHLINLAPAEVAALRQAPSLTIQSGSLTGTFLLSAMKPLLATMLECVADLRRVWNITDSSGAQSTLRERAKSNLAAFFSSSDYPAVALAAHQSGTVSFALLIDQAGKVADCTITATSGAAALDAQTCAVLKKRARCVPAVGADGKPAKDAIIGRIRWKMASGSAR